VLGELVLLWGASLVVRKPGDRHPWHTDIESSAPSAECASLWIGLAGTCADSALAVVSHSQHFATPLQRAAHEHGVPRERIGDGDVARWARAFDARAEQVVPAVADGHAVLFDGRLWHGARNDSADRTRFALLLQYATPRTPIRMPRPPRFDWPFETSELPRPPCVLVAGRNTHGVNRVVAGPAAIGGGVPALQSCIHPIPLPLARDPAIGWKPQRLFRGATPNLRGVGAHVSVLEPGCTPHPPHVHAQDELLLVLDGEATLLLGEDGRREPLERGAFSYYPAGFAHSIRNDAATPLTYMMWKWRADRGRAAAPLDARRVRFLDSDARLRRHGDGFETRTVLDGETADLARLHAHVSILRPDAGYAPHADRHDVAMIVLDGAIETGGERLGRNGVAFFAAGEPHGVRNVGSDPAVYLVLELHGRRAERREPTPPKRSRLRALWRALGAS
jgi:quercetin dioxygenase-like cupin family protein